MLGELAVGDDAPDFDLASTEGAVLMLRDEVPRTPVLLFFFGAVETAKPELQMLGGIASELAGSSVKIMAVSAAKLDELKQVQKDLSLGFPLLHDDRSLSAAYGIESTAESESSATILVLVGRDQRVLWSQRGAVAADVVRAATAASQNSSSTVNYPRKIINRLVDRWVD